MSEAFIPTEDAYSPEVRALHQHTAQRIEALLAGSDATEYTQNPNTEERQPINA